MKVLLSYILIVSFAVLPMYGCGGSSSSSTTDFEELKPLINTQISTTNQSAATYIGAEQTMLMFDPTTATGDAIIAPINTYTSALEAFESALGTLNTYSTSYGNDLSSSISIKDIPIDIEPKAQGSVDPLFVQQIGDLINQGKLEALEIQEMIDAGQYDEAQTAYNAYIQRNTSKAFNLGTSAIVGGGAAVITGLAIVSAPVTITATAVAGISIAVGTVVGAVWSWCTSSSESISSEFISKDASVSQCAYDSRELTTMGDDGNVAMTSFVPGTGTLVLTVQTADGNSAPLILENVTIGADGANINVEFAPVGTATEDQVASAVAGVTIDGQPVTIAGMTCANVVDVRASASPSNPSPGQSVTVTSTISPIVEGCTVSYSMSGTDGYTQSGSPSTSSSGAISFTIPGAEEGVIDRVSITASESGASTTVTYVF